MKKELLSIMGGTMLKEGWLEPSATVVVYTAEIDNVTDKYTDTFK